VYERLAEALAEEDEPDLAEAVGKLASRGHRDWRGKFDRAVS